MALYGAVMRELAGGAPSVADDRINYNVAPTQESLVFVHEDGRRLGESQQWGWRPPFMDGRPLPNAVAETAPTKPTFAHAFRFRRCVVPAAGFFEWREEGKARRPFLFSVKDAEVCAIAGLWTVERTVEKTVAGEAERDVRRFLLLTTPANAVVAPVHHRQAVLLDQDGVDAWLDPSTPPDRLVALCTAFPAEKMEACELSTLVNNYRNAGPEILAPIA